MGSSRCKKFPSLTFYGARDWAEVDQSVTINQTVSCDGRTGMCEVEKCNVFFVAGGHRGP